MKQSGWRKAAAPLLLVCTAGAALVWILSGMQGQGEAEPSYILRYADNQPSEYPTTKGGVYFSELVEQRTNGDVKIYVYGNEELGDEKSVIRQVQLGGIDMARVATAQLILYSEPMAVLCLPYLYRDAEHMWKVLDGEIGDGFLGEIGDSGLIGLSWYDAGARNFYTTEKQLTCLEDLSGLTIRVQEADYMKDMIWALGAIPEEMPYSMVYSALSTGAVDGAENNWSSYESMQHNQTARYMLEDEHVRIPEMQILSEVTAQKLPDEYMDIIRQCARESAQYERQLWAEWEQDARERAIQAGTVVTRLNAEEREKFQKASEPVYRKYGKGQERLIQKIIETE